MDEEQKHSHDWDWDWEEVALPIPLNPNPNLHQQLLHHDSSSLSSTDVIRSDYFSIESPISNPNLALDSDDATTGTDSPSEIDPAASWMDPGQFPGTMIGERTRTSSSESSDGKLHSECGGDVESPSDLLSGTQYDNKEEDEETRDSENEGVEMKTVAREEEGKGLNTSPGSGAWWRVPLEVIKYFAFRVSPVWPLSVAAAALMGFVLYRRRLMSKMKRKIQGIQLNVTVDDDKKVSQLMSRAARLNEAFSVVKRVPIIRTSLPAPGFASWPAVSLR